MLFQAAKPVTASYNDPSLAQMGCARLNEIGNLSIQNATENGGRLSGMFGIRSAQTNPIEAHALGAMTRSSAPGNAANTGLSGSLAAMLMNIANQTPNSGV